MEKKREMRGDFIPEEKTIFVPKGVTKKTRSRLVFLSSQPCDRR